jgi:tellurite resistance protein TerC
VDVPLWVWLATIGFIVALLVIDFIVVDSDPHEVTLREATFWSVFYIGIAIAFGIGLGLVTGDATLAAEYFGGWAVEKSLSIDNLFVFIVIFQQFAVPKAYQHRALLFGIVLALILRGIFIAAGAAVLANFAFGFLVFGLVLIFTGIQLFRHRDEDSAPEENAVLRYARRVVPSTEKFHGTALFTKVNGRRLATPMFFVLVAIGTTDVLFALDSIPAIFGITQEPYIVFTANAFALLGLRALFFLVEGLLSRLVYLSTGLSFILIFIGFKLVLEFLHKQNETIPKVPLPLSLAVIFGILAVTTVASLIASRRNPALRAHSGSLQHHEEGTDAGPAGPAAPGASTPGAED